MTVTTLHDAGAASQPSPAVAKPDRITGLDVTRGFAVMGILAMNIVAFAMPENAYVTPRAWGGDTGPDLWVWAVNYVLLDSKMRGLFSLLFGASTLLVIQSAVAAGQNPAGVHYGRMIVLGLFGLAHFFLLWFGDILFGYAVAGLLLYLFRNLSIKALRNWAIGFFVLTMLLAGAQFGIIAAGANPAMPAEIRDVYAKVSGKMAYNSPDQQEQLALYRSDFPTIVSTKLEEDAATPFINSLIFLPETLVLMLIGMMLYKSGMLRGEWSLERLARWRNGFLAGGIIANLVLLWWQFQSGLDAAILLMATFWVSIPFDIGMSVGYAALFMGLAQRFAASPLIARVAATGRAAFTNYLGTSLLMTAFFYGWGLGQFGYWSRIEIYGPVLVMWVVMLLWSKPWLDRFRYGPLEWLWRSLARLSPQPMRK